MECLGRYLPQEHKMMSNLKRPTGRYVIAERPGVLFTAGTRGEGNDDILSNDVDWVG